MRLNERISSLSAWGNALEALLSDRAENPENSQLDAVFRRAAVNGWFIASECERALKSIVNQLDRKALEDWMSAYKLPETNPNPQRTGIVMAGNIPAVGFHDLLCVLITGNIAVIRLSSDDKVLIPFFAEVLTSIEPRFKTQLVWVEQIRDVDQVIATGSNNTARYFEHYFAKYRHIIRRNRNSVAVLSGNESHADLEALSNDLFTYFGLGCRNVSRLFLPRGYDFNRLFPAMEPFSWLITHNKYMNNFDYHSALFLMESIPFLTNNYVIVRENAPYATPVSVLHYSYYDSLEEVEKELTANADQIQCRVGVNGLPFGTSQAPVLMDYADGVDTVKWLLGNTD